MSHYKSGGKYCSFDGCESKKGDKSVSFFTLPTDAERRKKWLEIINRPDLDKSDLKPNSYVVCSKHFDKSSIIFTPKLKSDAIPTRFAQEFKACDQATQTKDSYIQVVDVEKVKLEQWLKVINREDLLGKNLKRLSYRVCSRHFTPSSLKNKHLCPDAVPTLCLPNEDLEEEEPEEQTVHSEIICNSCKKPILGFRYKCITCPDYDLCSKCEMFEAHSEHYLLRIPKPVNFKEADNLIKKWQRFVNIEYVTVDSPKSCVSSDEDDMPITEYVKHCDSGIDLPEDIKTKIRNEVTRVLQIKTPETKKLKRKKESKKKETNKKRKEITEDKSSVTEELEALAPEVAFADVNDVRVGQILDIKHEIPSSDLTPTLEVTAVDQPMTDLNLTDADFILTSLG